ncbi:hypothetical protein JCM17380_27990 [Desulfosporosinus burensis]
MERTIYKAFKNIEEPDLLIYKPDYSQIRFAESKRLDSRDKLRENQVRGLVLLSVLLWKNGTSIKFIGRRNSRAENSWTTS